MNNVRLGGFARKVSVSLSAWPARAGCKAASETLPNERAALNVVGLWGARTLSSDRRVILLAATGYLTEPAPRQRIERFLAGLQAAMCPHKRVESGAAPARIVLPSEDGLRHRPQFPSSGFRPLPVCRQRRMANRRLVRACRLTTRLIHRRRFLRGQNTQVAERISTLPNEQAK